MYGPGTLVSDFCVEEFLRVYGIRPYDFDGDEDVDLADFAIFQRNFDGEHFRQEVFLSEVQND